VLPIPLKPETGLEWGTPTFVAGAGGRGHRSFNLPQARRLLVMTRGRVALTSAVTEGWREPSVSTLPVEENAGIAVLLIKSKFWR
jgi:hypothetical protein